MLIHLNPVETRLKQNYINYIYYITLNPIYYVLLYVDNYCNHQYEMSRSVYSLLEICYRCASRSADKLQNVCRISAECLQSVCGDDLQQVCKFADALQTKSAYHVKQRARKMHQLNNVYLKDRGGRSVIHQK